MNKFYQIAIVVSLLILIPCQLLAYDVVIDPGHGGDEQNRGGPAFTVDDTFGDTLYSDVSAGDTQITVNSVYYFSAEDGYDTIQIGTEIRSIDEIDTVTSTTFDILTLSSPLDNSHSAGDPVTVQDFLVQAMGQKDSGSPGDWGAADTDYTRLSYTHEVPTNQWDQWKRKENTDGAALGVLELLNTWKISTRLDTRLTNLGHTVELTKDNLMDEPSFQQRGQTTVGGEDPDLFISTHTNGGKDITTTAVRGCEYVPYKTHDYVASYNSSLEEPSKVWSPSHQFDVEWYVDDQFTTPAVTVEGGDTPVFLKGTTYYGKITDNVDNPVDPYPLRYRILKDDGTEVVSSTLATVGQSLPAYDVGRQQRADSYTISFTPTDSGLAQIELRGPFQGDEQHRFSRAVLDELKQVVPKSQTGNGLHGKYDVNCSDEYISCDLGLGNWVADVSDNHEPAFSLTEVAYHSGTYDGFPHISDAEFLISGGYDTSAQAIADAINNFDTKTQESRYGGAKEANNPHPFMVVDSLKLTGKTINKATDGDYGKGGFELLFRNQATDSEYFTVSTTGNENTGEYEMDLPPGDYRVDISYQDELVSSSQVDFKDTTYYITVTGYNDEEDFHIEPYAGVSGSAYYDGESVNDVWVAIYDENEEIVAEQNTTEDGIHSNNYYRIQRIDSGIYTLRAQRAGVGSDSIAGISLPANDITTGVDFDLEPRSWIAGDVKDARFTGVEVEGVEIKAYWEGDNELKGEDITDSEGMYEIQGIPHGFYRLELSKENYEPKTFEEFEIPLEGLPFGFMLDYRAVVKGNVTAEGSGEEIAAAQVEVYHPESDSTFVTTTSDTGWYQLKGIPAGDIEIVAAHPDFSADTATKTVELNEAYTVDFALKSLPVIEGTVIDDYTLLPVSGAEIVVASPELDNPLTATTNDSGEYRLTGVPVGTIELNCELDNYHTGTNLTNTTAGGTETVDFVLVSRWPARGKVVDYFTAEPIVGATAWIYEFDALIAGPAITDDAGEFETVLLDGGMYYLLVDANHYLSDGKLIDVYTGHPDTEVIELRPYRDIEINVLNTKTDEPANNIEVSISNDTTVETLVTDDSGKVVFENFEPRKNYLITAIGGVDTEPVSIYLADTSAGKMVVNANFTPEPEGFIDGKILNHFDLSQGVAGQVDVYDSTGVHVAGPHNSNTSGDYTAFALPPGEYTVRFSADNYLENEMVVDVVDLETTNATMELKPYRDIKVHATNTETGNNAGDVKIIVSNEFVNLEQQTNFSGEAIFENMIPLESYSIYAGEHDTTPVEVYLSDTTPEPLEAEVAYTPPPEGFLIVTVEDRFTGSEITNAGVTVKDEDNNTVASGNSGDSFTIIEGEYTVKASRSNYINNSTTVTVNGNQTTNRTIKLKPYRTVKVHLDHEDGGAAGGISVQLSGSGYNSTKTTSSSGNAYFYNVKPSEYYGVKVQYHSWTYFYLSTASYDGQLTETLNQTYSPPDGTVAGQVNDYCGGTVWRPQVDLYQGSTHIGNESTNSGDFSFTVPAGSYSLQAERSSYTSTSASVSVNPDVTTTKNFTLRRYDREIKVSVTNTETGNAAQGVAVTVSGGGISKTLDTGWGSAAGTRVFDDLLPGYSYTVSVNNGTTGVVSLNCSTTRKDINLTYTPPDS